MIRTETGLLLVIWTSSKKQKSAAQIFIIKHILIVTKVNYTRPNNHEPSF